jgi:hypothetical protein
LCAINCALIIALKPLKNTIIFLSFLECALRNIKHRNFITNFAQSTGTDFVSDLDPKNFNGENMVNGFFGLVGKADIQYKVSILAYKIKG